MCSQAGAGEQVEELVVPTDKLESQTSASASNDRAEWIDFDDLLSRLRSELTDEEWRLVDARFAGATWNELATLFDCSVDAARKRFRRVMDRLRETADELPGP